MARPREFDEQDVVARARDTFWANGIANTSITDLSAATDLSVGSLYKAFGSKAGLCHRTLDDYLDHAIAATDEVLGAADDPLTGLRAWLDGTAHGAANASPTRGCYAVIVATELAETDPIAREKLRAHDDRLAGRLRTAIDAAVRRGDLSCDPEAGARFLLAAVNGLQVQARKGIDLASARSVLDLALRALR